MHIETDRLILREWKPQDLPLISAINSHSQVMEFFPALLTPQQSQEAVERYQASHAREGFGMMATELKHTGEFIGILGMQTLALDVPGLARPAVEIGWRLGHNHWGAGLATEGARAVLAYAFHQVRLPRVVAVTASINLKSRRVMEKLGMTYQPALDFLHPLVPEGHVLQKHVLYSLEADCYPGR